MKSSERGWVRGAVVIGVAGTMMAVALLSPALAVRLATTSYVKAKIKAYKGEAEARFLDVAEGDGRYIENGVSTLERGPITMPDSSEAFIEVICPAGTRAIGGGGWGSNTGMLMEASYPSDGTGTDTTGTAAWTTWMVNLSGTTGSLFGYAICAKTDAALAKTAPSRASRSPADASSIAIERR